jgi:hypothetical protein
MEKKSYYAVIPATVRYDERLKLLSRMLYGEITALSNEKGYCWANNKYFATLYKVSIRTITDCIKQLIDCGYITSQIIYKENSKEVEQRILKLANTPRRNFQEGIEEKQYTPLEENFQDNITSINNTINNRKKKKEFTPPTLEEVKAYCEERKNNVNPQRFIDHYAVADWKDTNGKPVRNWKQKIISVWEKDSNKNSYQSISIPQQPTNPYKSYAEIKKEQEEMLQRIKEKTGQC